VDLRIIKRKAYILVYYNIIIDKMDEKLEQQILKIIKQNEVIWVSELHRELIKGEISICYKRLLDVLKELEGKKIITSEFVGRNRVIKLVKNG